MKNPDKPQFTGPVVSTKLPLICILALASVPFGVQAVQAGSVSVSLYSGSFEGDHPPPVTLGNVVRGNRFQLEIGKVIGLVNYEDRDHPVVIERVVTTETGAIVTCPWFMRVEGQGLGTRVNTAHTAMIPHQVICEKGGCKNEVGQVVTQGDLLFGKYYLPKVQSTDGKDLGFRDFDHGSLIYCPEFTVERRYSEKHLFDRLLILHSFRQEELVDLDVDFRRIYLTFENERLDRVTCSINDLWTNGDTIQVGDLKDCVLPLGDRFTMLAQSRFFFKDTRPCGKFVAEGVKRGDEIVPDWFLGWYECDGKAGRTPIEKQYTYPVRLELKFNDLILGEK